ncbi:MAG: hypothetical protein KDA78_18820 [Planctomycetaceae bacterium]|nr:hypothetical protein [Planctomycetaceae bacterium]
MKIVQFLEHHGIKINPFSQEDASIDHVFSEHCVNGVHHPGWDKIYGHPGHPSTSVVFGEKGSGKTALRMQMRNELLKHNATAGNERSFIIEYDDFNPFLDNFRERMHGRNRQPEKMLRKWRLWDHMDAILVLGVTKLVDRILKDRANTDPAIAVADERLQDLTHNERRDFLLLTAVYDRSFDEAPMRRWTSLRSRLKYRNWSCWKEFGIGLLATLVILGVTYWLELFPGYLKWISISVLVFWLPLIWKHLRLAWWAWDVSRQLRVIDRLPNSLRKILTRFPGQDILGQPIPRKNRSDDRYELLAKFQAILKSLGFEHIIVLMDRVDEPHLINGSAERMKDLVWPMFDNKFLKHPGFGFKMLLPADMAPFLQKQGRDFYEKSRLDKQNLILSLAWSGQSLYDMTNDRIKACSEKSDQPASMQQLFADDVSRDMLIDTFSRLRVPRHLFKFLHRLMLDHCSKYTDEEPNWKIARDTIQTTLALYLRDLESFDRGAGTL